MAGPHQLQVSLHASDLLGTPRPTANALKISADTPHCGGELFTFESLGSLKRAEPLVLVCVQLGEKANNSLAFSKDVALVLFSVRTVKASK
jgi:hypothetical protein